MRTSSIIAGLILILVGLFFLLLPFFPDLADSISIAELWPLIIVGVGGLFLLGALLGTPDLAIPGSIIAGIGLMLYYQNANNAWETWAYSWALIPVVLAPVLGHAASPWLRFRGGKGIASTFGVWSALTYWVVPTTLGGFMAVIMAVQSVNAWTVVMASVFTLIVLGIIHTETPLIVAFALNLALLVFTHRRELLSTPKWRGPSGKKKEAQN